MKVWHTALVYNVFILHPQPSIGVRSSKLQEPMGSPGRNEGDGDKTPGTINQTEGTKGGYIKRVEVWQRSRRRAGCECIASDSACASRIWRVIAGAGERHSEMLGGIIEARYNRVRKWKQVPDSSFKGSGWERAGRDGAVTAGKGLSDGWGLSLPESLLWVPVLLGCSMFSQLDI